MTSDDKVNILLVDDQPAKLLSYETILSGSAKILSKPRQRVRRWSNCCGTISPSSWWMFACRSWMDFSWRQ